MSNRSQYHRHISRVCWQMKQQVFFCVHSASEWHQARSTHIFANLDFSIAGLQTALVKKLKIEGKLLFKLQADPLSLHLHHRRFQ